MAQDGIFKKLYWSIGKYKIGFFTLFLLYIALCRYAAVFGAFVAGMACLNGTDFSAKLMASHAKCFEVHLIYRN
jgi:hypothetical protein